MSKKSKAAKAAKTPKAAKAVEPRRDETSHAPGADRSAERRAKAAEYYKANADKLREASRKSHARRREALRSAAAAVAAVYEALQGVVSENGAEFFDTYYKLGGEAMMTDLEDAARILGR